MQENLSEDNRYGATYAKGADGSASERHKKHATRKKRVRPRLERTADKLPKEKRAPERLGALQAAKTEPKPSHAKKMHSILLRPYQCSQAEASKFTAGST